MARHPIGRRRARLVAVSDRVMGDWALSELQRCSRSLPPTFRTQTSMRRSVLCLEAIHEAIAIAARWPCWWAWTLISIKCLRRIDRRMYIHPSELAIQIRRSRIPSISFGSLRPFARCPGLRRRCSLGRCSAASAAGPARPWWKNDLLARRASGDTARGRCRTHPDHAVAALSPKPRGISSRAYAGRRAVGSSADEF